MANLAANVNVDGTWYGPAHPDNKVTSDVREAITNPNVWETETRATSDATEVPMGTIDDVEEWVGNNPERARQALAAEQARPNGPRSTLVATLERTASGG